MLDYLSTTMAFKPCATKPQPNLDDHDILHATKEFQDLYAQYKELEETNYLSQLHFSKCMIEMKYKLEKRLEEKISFLNESPLKPLHTHGSSSSRSTYSTPRHQCLHLLDLKTSFEPIPNFHGKPIFDQDNDEDIDACYSLEKQQNDSRHTLERNFNPLEDYYYNILQIVLANELLMLPKSSSYGNPFLDIQYAYHQNNKHSTLDCIELKHRVQDLIDDGIVEISNDSCDEDTSLEKDHIDEPMSSSGVIDASASSNIHVSPKASKLLNMLPTKKERNAFHTSYSYPQGLPLKVNQANLHLAANLFHATKAKNAQPLCNSMLSSPTSTNSLLSPHSPLSLEVAPC